MKMLGKCRDCRHAVTKRWGSVVERLCPNCYFRKWQASSSTRYREATPAEREVLDDAREKLVIAFLKGDMHTWAEATRFLKNKLKNLRA